METVKLQAHVGQDGLLKLNVPIGATNVDCDVTITVQQPLSQVEWEAFLEATEGSLADDPIERPAQGVYEQRDQMK